MAISRAISRAKVYVPVAEGLTLSSCAPEIKSLQPVKAPDHGHDQAPDHPVVNVGHNAFKELIKEQFSIRSPDELNMQMNLTYEELNSIRYAAGFVPRAIKKKLQKKKKPDNSLHKDCILYLEELMSGDGDTELSSADWVHSIHVNLGDLVCVNDMTFELFLSMELELRSHLKINHTHLGDEVVVQITDVRMFSIYGLGTVIAALHCLRR